MLARRPALVTEEEFLSLPETMQKVELIDGEVIVSPAPSPGHQELVGRLYYALSTWARTRKDVTVGLSPVDIRFAPDRILQPDLFVMFERIRRDARGPITRIPELCVEVLSGDRVHDRVTKRMIYAAAGVREYWIVEPMPLIERRTGPGLAVEDVVEGVLTTPLLPGFSLDLAELYAD